MIPWLSVLIWLPILSGVAVLGIGDGPSGSPAKIARAFALLSSVVCLALCWPLLQGFDYASAAYQFMENRPWFEAFDMRYVLGIDGFALPLILLTCFFTPFVILNAWGLSKKPSQYFAAFLIMQGTMVGVFCAMDAVLFYLFFEAMLIPMFLIIGVWGGENRIYATVKFFLYTFLGSVFLLIALVFLHYQAKMVGLSDSFMITTFQALSLPYNLQVPLFIAMLLAFAIKIPMWPVHTWLPDAHVQAPTGGSVVLAAIMLKVGGYGIMRFILPIVPDAALVFAPWVIIAALIAIVYVGLVAMVQTDMKKLIAYSSVAHMGFVTLGLFAVFALAGKPQGAELALNGAYLQMISHGFISGALFFCVGILYDRVHTKAIAAYGGVAQSMPVFAAFFVFFAMANCGLPGTSGFVGEFMVILGVWQANPLYAALAAITLILGASYSLWMVKRVAFGPVTNPAIANLPDLGKREWICLASLAIFVLAIGIWPKPLTDMTAVSTQTLLSQTAFSKL